MVRAEDSGTYKPTPEEIVEMTAAIRANWNETTMLFRGSNLQKPSEKVYNRTVKMLLSSRDIENYEKGE